MKRRLAASLVAVLLSGALSNPPAWAGGPVARVLLYYSATCPACATVKADVLPAIQQRYGQSLEIRLLEISDAANGEALLATVRRLNVPQDQWVVPFALIGDRYLAGSGAIAGSLAAEIDRALAAGGVDWPQGPTPDPSPTPREQQCRTCEEEMERWAAAAARQPTPAVLPVEPLPEPAPTPSPVTPAERQPASDPPVSGLGLKGEPGPAMMAAGLFAAMALSLAAVLVAVIRWVRWPLSARRPGWLVPAAALIGLGAAAYLSLAELTRTPLQCGFLSDCDLVQTSVYGRIGGVPVAVFGVLGYLGVLAAWLAARRGPEPWRAPAAWAMLAMAMAGTAYSAYLTFLEPFVIGGVCPWCLTSAAAMTLVLVSAAAAIRPARLRAGGQAGPEGGQR